MRRTRISRAHNDYQQLEQRQLLAGNIAVSFQENSLLITGDTSANQIQVTGTPDGLVQVTGLTGTSINSGSSPFQTGAPVQNVTIQLGTGNDTVNVHGLVATGFLNIDLAAGTDLSRISDSNIRVLNIDGREGDDVMHFHNVFSHGFITLQGQAGSNTMAVTNMATNRGLIVTTEGGSDTFAIDNLGVRDDLIISSGGGADHVFMTGSTYAHKASFNLGADNDTLAITPRVSQASAVFQNRLIVQMGAGEDTVFVDPAVVSRKSTSFDGGDGNDVIGTEGASLRRAGYSRFEHLGLPNIDVAFEGFYAHLRSLNIDTEPFGRLFVASVLTVQSTALVVPANSPPVAVDSQLTLTGASTTTVSGATVRVQNNVSTEDVLTFSNSGNISGSFNASTGILTLTGTGTLSEYQTALRNVTYDNTRAISLSGSRQITFDVITSVGTVTGSRTVTLQGLTPAVLAVNDAPLTIPQTSAAVAIDGQLTLTGDSQITVSGATVSVVNFTAGQDIITFPNDPGITGVFDGTSGVMTLTGNGTLAAYQTALRTLTYDTSATAFVPKTISFVVNTSIGNVTDTRSLVPAAVLTVTSAPLKHFGHSTANSVDSQLVLTGQTGTSVTQARVSITGGYVPGEDVLAFANTVNITGNFDSASGVMTLTGTGSVANFQSALRSVSYDNTNTDTLEETRTLEFLVTTNQGDFTASRQIDLGDQLAIQAYLSDNQLTAQTTASGLHYIIDTVGNGTFPSVSDTVRVNYVGRLVNGSEFDSNNNITFPLTNVIDGWQEGIPLFSVGGSGRLIIPSSLAYQNQTRPGIPANSVLVFNIDLLGIEPSAP